MDDLFGVRYPNCRAVLAVIAIGKLRYRSHKTAAIWVALYDNSEYVIFHFSLLFNVGILRRPDIQSRIGRIENSGMADIEIRDMKRGECRRFHPIRVGSLVHFQFVESRGTDYIGVLTAVESHHPTAVRERTIVRPVTPNIHISIS